MADEDVKAEEAEDEQGTDDAAVEAKPSDDWKTRARKQERRARKAEQDLADALERIKTREQEEQSDHEKALQAARDEGAAAARAESLKQLQAQRLEAETLRVASRSIKLGDDETARFADPDLAHVYVQGLLARGDLDADDLFDERGKPDSQALEDALSGLLRRDRSLAAHEGNGRRPQGSADGGKGQGPGPDPRTDMSMEEARKYASRSR